MRSRHSSGAAYFSNRIALGNNLSCGHKNGPVNGSQRMRRALKAPEHPAAVDEYSHDRKSWAENLFQFA